MTTQKNYEITTTFLRMARRSPAFLRRPVNPSDRRDIGIVLMHSDADYLDLTPGIMLAERGYTTLAANPPVATLENKMAALGECVNYMRSLPEIRKVILFGHSGGASLISAYQAAAENGVGIFQGPEMLYKCPDIPNLQSADGVLIVDSNWGNGVMTLVSLDPCVTDETSGRDLDLSLDPTDPANGYDPKGSHYSEEFVARFAKAQGERMNRIVERAVERLHAIEAGRGLFNDDEPFLIPGGSQAGPCNKLFPQDVRYLSHTKREHTLLHGDGSETTQVVHSVRLPMPCRALSGALAGASGARTVKLFLSNCCVVTDGFRYDDVDMYGLDFSRSFCNTPGNIRHIHAPILFIGLTGGYESMAAERIYDACPSVDKSIVYVEGATHNFAPNHDAERTPGEFGDTEAAMCDYIDKWLSAERFGK